jgi:predicted dehydrogenase
VTRRLRVGVVGCGGIAQMMHLPTLAERPDLFEIVALADVSSKTLNAVAKRYPAPLRTTDPGAIFADPRVEAVLLLHSGSHHEGSIRAIEAGKHVFVEKPVAFSLEETEGVARVAKRSRLVFMVGYHKRYDPAFRAARDEVRRIKGLRFVDATILHPDDGAYRTHHAVFPIRPYREASEPAAFAAAAHDAENGSTAAAVERTAGRRSSTARRVATSMLFQSLIHDIDALRGILGEPEEVLSAHTWMSGMAQSSLTRFPGDVRVALNWIYVGGLKHYDERLIFVGPGRRVELRFPSPYLRNAPTPLTVERASAGRLVVERHTVSYEEAFKVELHHFRECVEGRKKPETGIDDALGDARWIQAIATRLA